MMKKNKKATNIIWDVDGDISLKENLPKEIIIPDELQESEEISDYITQQTGFCHKGFTIKEEKNNYLQ